MWLAGKGTGKIFLDSPTIQRIAGPSKLLFATAFIVLSIIGVKVLDGDFLTIAGVLLGAAFVYYFTMVAINMNKIKAAIHPEDYSHEIPHFKNAL